MRYLAFLLIAVITLLAPANLYAQVKRAAPKNRVAQSHHESLTNQKAQAVNPFYRFVSNHRWGDHLQIRLNNEQHLTGTLAMVEQDHFVLMHRGKPTIVAYSDIASIKAGKPFWQQVGTIAMLPLKGAWYAVIIPVGFGMLGIAVLIGKITGRDPLQDF